MSNDRTMPLERYSLLFVLIGIVVVILFSGYDVLVGKFGFETKTSLRAELVTVKSDLQRTTQANETLQKDLQRVRLEHKEAQASLARLEESKTVIQETVAAAKVERSNQVRKPIPKLIASKITSPLKPLVAEDTDTEKRQTSRANIHALHALHTELFPTT